MTHDAPLLIQGARVVDPAHGQTVVRDIRIEQGRIVDTFSTSQPATVMDAAGLITMPGGVDMHTHIASSGVNAARQLQGDTTFASHRLVPSTFDTGRLYSAIGYTTAIEAAVAPSDAHHAHLQLQDTPNLDTGILVLVDNHQLVIDLLEKDDYTGAKAVVTQILHRTGAMGMKVVNPAGVAAWRRDAGQDQIQSIDQPIPGMTVTPRKILQALTRISEELDLPHPTHIHGNRLGMPGNFQTLIDSLQAIEGRRAHVAHLQFYGYGQTKKGGYTSAANELCEFLDSHPNVTADVGMVMFGPAFTITADTPLEHSLWRKTGSPGRPTVFWEGESEAATGVMPASYSRKNRIHSLQWAIGMELLLLCKNPWQISLSIDHPNGGSFLHFPTIMAMLMNKSLRDQMLQSAHLYASKHTSLTSIDREMTLEEIAILTRSGPARMLGLHTKGHLAAGADADLVLYADPASISPAELAHHLATPQAVIRHGQVIARHGQSLHDQPGRQLRANIANDSCGQQLLSTWLQTHGSVDSRQFGLSSQDLAAMNAITRKKTSPSP